MVTFQIGKQRLAVDETKVIALVDQEREQYIEGAIVKTRVTTIFFNDAEDCGFVVPLSLEETAEKLNKSLT